MKVLIVPEENQVAKKVGEYLNEHHMQVTVASDATDAVNQVVNQTPPCAIIAVEEQGKVDPAKLSQDLRQNGSDAPILVMSDTTSAEKSVTALDSGADDVIDQSSEMTEVNARLRAMSRRCNAVEGTPRQIEQLKIDVENRNVTYAGHDVILTAREFDVLELLSRRAGKLVSREVIFDAAWSAPPTSNVLDVIICRIRKKLEAVGGINMLQTIKGSGYRLNVPESVSAEAVH